MARRDIVGARRVDAKRWKGRQVGTQDGGARRGERVMARRRRRGKFGESSGHATIRRTPPFAPARTGTSRCHSPLTYPNPAQKTETSSNPPFPLRPPSPGAPCASAPLPQPLSPRYLYRFTLLVHSSSASRPLPLFLSSPSLSSPYYPSSSTPLYHRQSPCSVLLVFLRYSWRGATTRRQSGRRHNRSCVAIYTRWFFVAPAICSSARRTSSRET